MDSPHPTHVVALPYRDYWFQENFGKSVRDLCMIEAIRSLDSVVGITAVCRPRVLWDKLQFLQPQVEVCDGKLMWVRSRSFDVLGSLAGRAWTRTAMARLVANAVSNALRRSERVTLFDAHPISMFSRDIVKNPRVHYHFDVIDNFCKHVRFSDRERALAAEKMSFVRDHAASISAVSEAAVQSLGFEGAKIMPSGVLQSDISPVALDKAVYDFGLLGFIDEKTDIPFIRALSNAGYSVLIGGEIYDRRVGKELSKIPGVRLNGRFKSDEVSSLAAQFRFGLVAYETSKLHDGSPTKLFRYLACGRPVVSNLRTELHGPAILYVDRDDPMAKVDRFVLSWRSRLNDSVREIADSLPQGYVWENRMREIFG